MNICENSLIPEMNIRNYFVPKRFNLNYYFRPLVQLIAMFLLLFLPNSRISNLILYNRVPQLGDLITLVVIFLLLETLTVLVIIRYISFGKEFLKIFLSIFFPIYFINLGSFILVEFGINNWWFNMDEMLKVPLTLLIYLILAGFIHGNYFSYIYEEDKKKAFWYSASEIFFIGLSFTYLMYPIFIQHKTTGIIRFFPLLLGIIFLRASSKLINEKYAEYMSHS